MPQHAFVPGQIAEAEGRTFRNLYPRQARGLLIGIAGGVLGALVLGTVTPWRCGLVFSLALPGFGYGFFTPGGKPLEYWAGLWLRYYLAPRSLTDRPRTRVKEAPRREQRRRRH